MNCLVIADLHIGYEAALEKQGIILPTSQYPEIKNQIKEMLKISKAKKLIILGDIKHEFGEATRQEWLEVSDFLDFLQQRGVELLVVRGNHDNFLIPILKKRGIQLYDPYYAEAGYFFFHGHKEASLSMLDKKHHTLIMGHEHPAVVIRDELGVKQKFKCFLKGKIFGKNLIVLPALSPLSEGSVINTLSKEELLSPILKKCDIKSFYAYIIEPKQTVVALPVENLIF